MRHYYAKQNIEGEIDLSFLEGKIRCFASNPVEFDIKTQYFHCMSDFINELNNHSVVYNLRVTVVYSAPDQELPYSPAIYYIARYQK
jgi:hypothetical protein